MADKEHDNEEEDDLELEGYKECLPLKIASWLGIILTLGFLRLFFFWLPTWHLKSTHIRCSLAEARMLLVTDIYEKLKSQIICTVRDVNLASVRHSFHNVAMRDSNESNRFVDEQFESIFENELLIYFTDGTYKVLGDTLRTVLVKKLPYVWDEERLTFRRLAGIGPGLNHHDIHHYTQYTEQQRDAMRLVYGNNELNMPDNPFLIIVLIETFTPFYLVQFGNSILWGVTGDWTYTGLLFAFTFIVILLTSLQTRLNQKTLKKLMNSDISYFKVLSGTDYHTVENIDLVPGDRIILPEKGCRVPCDGLVISGNCIVSESLLTGESVPQTKMPLPMTFVDYNDKDLSSHSMYMGTNMLRSQGGEPLQLLVTRTGFCTTQGSIVRSILYPRPLDYEFENSVIKFAFIIFGLSLLGALINDIVEISKEISAGTIIVNTVKISIMLIPAIMPIISASKLIGMRRLILQQIYCLNPQALNLAGSATCTCFDKTGTLTEDGLDVYSILPSSSAMFMDAAGGGDDPRIVQDHPLLKAMACCHSIMIIDEQITGDPIDLKMFDWTKWDFSMDEDTGLGFPVVSSKDGQNNSIQILHQNQFSSRLQRMSVVVQCHDEVTLRLFCKGSPESITSLSLPHTVPENFCSALESFTRRGFRVLALGTRVLNEQSMGELQTHTREELETQLEFLGLIAFENKLKRETIPAIQELKKANYKIIMITGDNMQTGESVARECKIIDDNEAILELHEEDHQLKCIITKRNATMSDSYGDMENGGTGGDYVFCVSGQAWKILKVKYASFLPQVLVKTAVFARMSSDQKKEVVKELGKLGYGVVMCGDGANDCGALRAANVGISLAQTEASTAASFTSKVDDISCVIKVIRHGRCSLSTSFSFFKYMIMSSILMTIVERFMQGMNSNLSEGEITYLNLISNVNFALWFPRNDAYMGPLPSDLPLSTLISFSPVFSILCNISVYFCFQVGNFFLVKRFAWYKSLSGNLSYESYAMFCTVALQLIILAITQSPGYPFRQPVYTNYLLTASLSVMLIVGLIITIHPPKLFTDWLQIPAPPSLDFPIAMLGLVICNFVLCMALEKIIIEKIIYNRCKRYPFLFKTKSKEKFREIQERIVDYDWASQEFQCTFKNDI